MAPQLVAVLLLVLGLSATGFGPPGLVPSSSTQDPLQAYQVPAVQRMAAPPIGAAAAIVVDEQTGQVLFASDERRRLPMASTTKIMTALLALERGQPAQMVKPRITAADMPGSSLMGLVPGEQLPLSDLLYGLLLPSGNDAAIAIAEAVGGSEAGFVELMNRRAAELGLANTRFANPHGLDAPGHYTTAADLAQLTRIALRQRAFAEIVATREKTVQGKATYRLRNTNPVLGQPGVEGVKTGHTDLAGACLVTVVRRDGHRVVTVVLNSPDYGAESLTLAEHAFSGYVWTRLTLPDSPLERQLSAGVAPAAGIQAPVVPIPAWQQPYVRVHVLPEAREARLKVAGSTIATLPLVESGSATPRPTQSR